MMTASLTGIGDWTDKDPGPHHELLVDVVGQSVIGELEEERPHHSGSRGC